MKRGRKINKKILIVFGVVVIIIAAILLSYYAAMGILFSPLNLIVNVNFDSNGNTDGISGKATDFSKLTSGVNADSYNSNFNYNPGLNSFSISVWVKPTNSNSLMEIVSKRNAYLGTEAGYDLAIKSDGSVYAYLGDGKTGVVTNLKPKTDLFYGNWHNIVIAYDRKVQSFVYVDGELVGVKDVNQVKSVSNTNKLFIGGGSVDGKFAKFNGIIDEVQIYNKFLSAKEVLEIYNKFSVKKCNDGIDNDGDGLIDLDDGGCIGSSSRNTEMDYDSDAWKIVDGKYVPREAEENTKYFDFYLGVRPHTFGILKYENGDDAVKDFCSPVYDVSGVKYIVREYFYRGESVYKTYFSCDKCSADGKSGVGYCEEIGCKVNNLNNLECYSNE